MALASGTKLGHYEILALVGAGGMGEVYRARDSHLPRFVAIKILPKTISTDTEHKQRFEREARVLASINHPNILSIHDTAVEGALQYFVCELLEGMNLRHRLQEGALPIRKCVDVAMQVASGLAAAHDKGIIHRDLKPENIFLLKDGRVKILDFGLAKQATAGPDGKTLSVAEAKTQDGLLLGTVGYMSPEQVRGRPADARSDIFSLGVVLYEMVSGRRAFRGDSAVEVMNAILKDEPPELANDRNIQTGFSALIHRCMEKDPEERIQSARDLRFALEVVDSGSTTSAQTLPGRTTSPRMLSYASVAALLLSTAFLVGRWSDRSSSLAASSFQRLTFRPGTLLAARFGSDGRTIVYSGKYDGGPSRIYVTSSDSPESRALQGSEISVMSISDSGTLAVLRGCRQAVQLVDCWGTLAIMPLSGGAPKDMMADVEAADWLPKSDDLAVAYKVSGLTRVEFPIGNPVYETPGWIQTIRVSPDGNEIGIADHDIFGSDNGKVLIVDRKGRKIAETGYFVSQEGLSWSASSKQLWFTGSTPGHGWADTLYSLDLAGRQRPLSHFEGLTRLYDISVDGALLLSKEDWRGELKLRSRSGSDEKDLSWFDFSEVTDLASDGRQLLFVEGGDAPAPRVTDLYVRHSDGSPPTRVGEGDWGGLSPDERWVISTSNTTGPNTGLVLVPTGIGSRKPLVSDASLQSFAQTGFLGDGQQIVYLGTDGKAWRVYKQNLNGGKPVAITPEVGQYESRAYQLGSPDGKYVWTRDLQGRMTIYPVDQSSPPRPVPGLTTDDFPANWGTDSNHVYVYRNDFPILVSEVDVNTGKRTIVAEISPKDPIGLEGVLSLRTTPDGKSIAYSYIRALAQLYLARDLSKQQ